MDEVSIHLPDKTGARRLRPRSTPRTDTTIESHRTRSVYRLTQEDDRVYAASGGDFSLEGYSLFKHGDERWARRFGHEIADFLMAAESDLFARVRSDEVLVASFPYKYVPTAAALMVDHTVTRLNHILSGENKPSVGYLHAFKYPWWPSGEHYFAHMEEKARRRILDNVELSIDKDRLRGAHLIIVDDIRVTGATQDKFLQLLYPVKGLRSLTVVFLCDVDPVVAKADPAIEGRLNQHKVKTLDDVAAIVATGEFQWNIRVVKFVLEQRAVKDFGVFIRGLNNGLLLALYKYVVFNDYHFERKYKRRIQIIRSAVESRRII
jgi:hypothetical protein